MTQTVTGAVATRDNSPGALITRYQADFAAVLPTHVKPETFVRLSQGLLRRDTNLADAATKNPGSFLAALLECARLGHEPGTDQYALTHFKNNKTGIPEIVGIEQYQGEIERIYRAGAVSTIKCEVVREHDEFDWSPTQMKVPYHRYDPFASEDERGPLRGVYAYAEFPGGATSQVVVMGRSEVMKHRAVAKSKVFWDGPWEQSMWKKTSIHELEKWVPTSSEFRREQLRAAVEADNLRHRAPTTPPGEVPAHDAETGEVVEAELVDEPPESPLLDTSSTLAKHMFSLLGECGITDKTERLAYVSDVVGREVATSKALTEAEAEHVIADLNVMRDRLRAEAEQGQDEGPQS